MIRSATFCFSLLCSLAFSTVAVGQISQPFSTGPRSPESVFSDSTSWPWRPYDVTQYRLLLDWRPVFNNKSQIFHGKNVIDITLTSDTASVPFDAVDMSIDTIAINDSVWSQTPPQPDQNSILTIPLPSQLRKAGTNIKIAISYTRTSTANDGIYFYPKHTFVGFGPTHDSVFVEEDLAYTMSEPLDARKWMPCNDYPYDKAASSISIIVPSGYDAQSNGTLQSIDSNADESHTYNWKSDRPISTYLMVADASKFIEWSDVYHRVSNPNDSVPVVYFAWPADYYQTQITDGSKYNAQYALRKTPLMLAAFSKRVGEYPFVQYGQVPVQPFGYGGQEHQTMTTITRTWFRGQDEDGIAHELFHQWFGDKTTCETFSDIWLNEGFATYGEALWEEDQNGTAGYLNVLHTKAAEFFGSRQGTNAIPIYAPPIDNIFNYPTTYAKGGLVLHMMRRMIDNDTMFFGTLRDYSNAFAYRSANTRQFRDFIQARTGVNLPIPLSDFIDQWIYQPDYPVYNFKWGQSGSNTVFLNVAQSQDSTDHYSMALRFRAYGSGHEKDLVFYNTARTQRFAAQLDFRLDSLVFDQDAAILSRATMQKDESLSVADPALMNAFTVSYEAGSVRLNFTPVETSEASLEIVSSIGSVVRTNMLRSGMSSFMVRDASLPSGIYFGVLKDGSRRAMVKFELER